MRRRFPGIVAVILMVVVASPSPAQVRFGANLSWADDTDVGLGARLSFGLGSASQRRPVEGYVTFDYFFPDTFDYWEVTGNVAYRFTTTGSAKPYGGAGLGYGNSSIDTGSPGLGFGSGSDFFLNLFGGVRFQMLGSVQPFAEARFELGDGSQLVLVGGVFFGKP
jgi:opacity protein-like surface antigen